MHWRDVVSFLWILVEGSVMELKPARFCFFPPQLPLCLDSNVLTNHAHIHLFDRWTLLVILPSFFLFLKHIRATFKRKEKNLISTFWHVPSSSSSSAIPSSSSSHCPTCVCRLRCHPSFVLLQVFLPASGSSQSGVQVRSPAASLPSHRALWRWALSASSPQTLL